MKTKRNLLKAGLPVKASMLVMGTGQLMQKQWIKGILYLSVLGTYIWYLVAGGVEDAIGFFTLGTQKADPWLGTPGDDSIMMLLKGLLFYIITALVIAIHIANVNNAYACDVKIKAGVKLPGFIKAVSIFADKKFYILALAVPIVGVLIFNVLPIVFMILISFTNYGGDIVPPELVDWVGFDNFAKILSLSEIKDTFLKILVWNLVWAFLATFLNYFGGLGLALLLNKKCVKGKAFWRAFPILAYAVPGFITLLGFKFMFSYGGPINYYITMNGGNAIGFRYDVSCRSA